MPQRPTDDQEPKRRRRGGQLSDEFRAIELEREAVRLERSVLVGIAYGRDTEEAEESLAELQRLAETAGSEVLDTFVQRRGTPDPATFLGKGKADEVRDSVKMLGADTVIVDEELSPGQLRNLEKIVGVKVIDRTALILDIFAQHAHSVEGKAQVELAQLNYLIPRLRGWGDSMSRLGGGIGTRGPGETKLEVDRRRINTRIAKLRRQIREMDKTRATKRQQRERRGVPSATLVGYTNAGKSTLLNRLTQAGVLVQDKLFSTLDPTTRRLDLPDGRSSVLSDTVGFVRRLPHMLVEAFKSTLEEASRADLIVHVVDGSSSDPEGQHAAVLEVLDEIGAAEVPQLLVVNKTDALDEMALARLRRHWPDGVFVSAATGAGTDELLAAMAERLPRPEIEVELLIPYDRGDVAAALHAAGAVVSERYADDGTIVTARLRADQLGRLDAYVLPGERSRLAVPDEDL
ncbi:MAG TPA: GTPase HflX [Actinomycetota bacterium]|nr:GTPase HflX [Actinomycetota bacterium]